MNFRQPTTREEIAAEKARLTELVESLHANSRRVLVERGLSPLEIAALMANIEEMRANLPQYLQDADELWSKAAGLERVQ